MSDQKDRNMVVENPLELQLVFGELYLTDEVAAEPVAPVAANLPETAVVQPPEPIIQTAEVQPPADEKVEEPVVLSNQVYSKPVRVFIHAAPGLVPEGADITDLIARMLSIVQLNGQVVNLDIADVIQTDKPAWDETMLAGAEKAVFFGFHQDTGGHVIEAHPLLKILHVPALKAIMAGKEQKAAFAENLRRYFLD